MRLSPAARSFVRRTTSPPVSSATYAAPATAALSASRPPSAEAGPTAVVAARTSSAGPNSASGSPAVERAGSSADASRKYSVTFVLRLASSSRRSSGMASLWRNPADTSTADRRPVAPASLALARSSSASTCRAWADARWHAAVASAWTSGPHAGAQLVAQAGGLVSSLYAREGRRVVRHVDQARLRVGHRCGGRVAAVEAAQPVDDCGEACRCLRNGQGPALTAACRREQDEVAGGSRPRERGKRLARAGALRVRQAEVVEDDRHWGRGRAPRRQRVPGRRRERVGRLKAVDRLRCSVLGQHEVVPREAGDHAAPAVEHDCVDEDLLDARREDGRLRRGRPRRGGQDQQRDGPRSHAHGSRR